MSQVGSTSPIQQAKQSTPVSAEAAKKIGELRDALKNIKSLMREPDSILWNVNHIHKYMLNDDLNNFILGAEGRAGGPTKKEQAAIKDLRKTILALDKALTLLGYKRNFSFRSDIPESERADLDWISDRFVQFQKDRGMMDKGDTQKRAAIGKKTIDELIKAMNRKITDLTINNC